MKAIHCLLLALLLALTLAEEKKPFAGVFAATWLGGYCNNNSNCDEEHVNRWDGKSFTIHGLWPSFFTKPDIADGYENFTLTSIKDEDLLDDMYNFWPPTASSTAQHPDETYEDNDHWLWHHEYNKHGKDYNEIFKIYQSKNHESSTTQSFQQTYFQKAINFYKIQEQLQKVNLDKFPTNQKGNKILKRSQLAEAIGIDQSQFVARCNTNETIVKEIHICLRIKNDMSIEREKCSEINKDQKRKTKDNCKSDSPLEFKGYNKGSKQERVTAKSGNNDAEGRLEAAKAPKISSTKFYPGVFAATWLGGFCHPNKCQSSLYNLWDTKSFTIHGLWPNSVHREGSFDEFDRKFIKDQDLLDDMYNYWPPSSNNDDQHLNEPYADNQHWLWHHEYNKHGKDYAYMLRQFQPQNYKDANTQVLQETYFHKAINFYKSQKKLQKLNLDNFPVNKYGNKVLSKQQLADAIGINQNQFVVQCSNPSSMVREIQICLHYNSDLSIAPVKCSKINQEQDRITKDTCKEPFEFKDYNRKDSNQQRVTADSDGNKVKDQLEDAKPIQNSDALQSFSAVFVATWLGGFCYPNKCQDDLYGLWDAQSFNIHGLWPNNVPDTRKRYDNFTLENIEDEKLLDDMYNYWPPSANYQTKHKENYKDYKHWLWHHEYNNHGKDYSYILKTFQSDTYKSASSQKLQQTYFNRTINLYKGYKLQQIDLSKFPKNIFGDKVLSKQQLAGVIGVHQDYFVARCETPRSVVKEIQICLSINGDMSITKKLCSEIRKTQTNTRFKTEDSCEFPLSFKDYSEDSHQNRVTDKP